MGLYQNISKPRFWVPITPFLFNNGLLGVHDNYKNLITLDSSSPTLFNSGSYEISFNFLDSSWIDLGSKYFIGIMGHSLATCLPEDGFVSLTGNDNSQFSTLTGYNQINHTGDVDGIQPNYDGFTLREFNFDSQISDLGFSFNLDAKCFIESIVIGKVYDSNHLPASPNLSATFYRDYQNTHSTTDKGLKYTNTHYMVNPNTSKTILGSNTVIGGRSEIKRWNLTFENVNEENIFSNTDSLTPLQQDGVSQELTSSFYKTNNTFDQLTHFLMGDCFPFIFQPDEDNYMPDQFSICRFDSPEFTMTRSSLNAYNYSIGIQEEF